jgi:hypothetical protein
MIYTTVILPIVLYWLENRSLTIREEYRLGVVDNRVLRRIFVQGGSNMTGTDCM